MESILVEKITDKKAVIFDVDGTLMATHDVFINGFNELKEVLTLEYGEEIGDSLYEEIIFETYHKDGKYKGIMDINYIAEKFTETLIERELLENTQEAKDTIEKPLKNIYNTIPKFLPGAKELLIHLLDNNIRIAFCTHSGDWGKDKVEAIWEEIGMPHEELIYNSIPLDKVKNGSEYLKVINMLDLKPSDVVVVGDDLKADIIAPLEIGVDTCVFYEWKEDYKTEFRNNEVVLPEGNHKVITTDSLKYVKSLF